MARFETRDQVRLAAEGVRGTYPHSLTIYRRMSANWYAAFYADKDLLGLQGVGRGKRVTSQGLLEVILRAPAPWLSSPAA